MVKNSHFPKAYLHDAAHSMNYKYVAEEPCAILGHYSCSIQCNGQSFDIFVSEGHCVK